MISCAVPPAPTTRIFAERAGPRLAANMHAAKSWQASYPARAIRLWRPYSLARAVSNFSAEVLGDDFKTVLRVLESSYASRFDKKNSLILCAAFPSGMWNSNAKPHHQNETPANASRNCSALMPRCRGSKANAVRSAGQQRLGRLGGALSGRANRASRAWVAGKRPNGWITAELSR